MRSLVSGLLAVILASCPIWCATFEATLGACQRHEAHGPGDHEDPSAPAPVNNDDCVCNGAVAPAEPDGAGSPLAKGRLAGPPVAPEPAPGPGPIDRLLRPAPGGAGPPGWCAPSSQGLRAPLRC